MDLHCILIFASLRFISVRDMNDNTVIFVVIYHKGYGVKKSIKIEVVIEVDITFI